MHAQAPQIGPITAAERIAFVDILRGLALFGILAANMRSFFAPLAAYDNIYPLYPAAHDIITQVLIETFIQGKFVSIFSFLFGLGFAIQMTRADASGTAFLRFYPRRLAALALFGLLHGLLFWPGDILLTYAVAGFFLLLFRNRRQTTLLWWAGSILSLPIIASIVVLGLYLSPWRPHWLEPKPPDIAKWHAIIHTYADGTLREKLAQHWADWKDEVSYTAFAIYATGLFLLGMWVWRANIVQRLPAWRPVLLRMRAWCLPVGLACSLYVAIVRAIVPAGHFSFAKWFANILWLPGAHILAAGYIAALALLYLHDPWRRRLQIFAAVGRMALTNYLAQSIVCTSFFFGPGRHLYGQIGPAAGLLPTVGLYAAQTAFSNAWLRAFRFGPLEYLWRGMTYGRFPPLRHATAASQPNTT
jgi:uncharacterized protein